MCRVISSSEARLVEHIGHRKVSTAPAASWGARAAANLSARSWAVPTSVLDGSGAFLAAGRLAAELAAGRGGAAPVTRRLLLAPPLAASWDRRTDAQSWSSGMR